MNTNRKIKAAESRIKESLSSATTGDIITSYHVSRQTQITNPAIVQEALKNLVSSGVLLQRSQAVSSYSINPCNAKPHTPLGLNYEQPY